MLSAQDMQLMKRLLTDHKVPSEFKEKLIKLIVNQGASVSTIVRILENHLKGGVIHSKT